MLLLLFSLLLLLIATPACANGIAPEMIYYWGAFYAAIVFTLGLLLEYICVCIMARAKTNRLYLRALLCTFVMNLASTIVGAIFRGPFAILYVIYIGKLHSLNTISSTIIQNIIGIGGIYLIYVIINTLIEAPIAAYAFFPKIERKRVWLWVFIANCLSMGLITIMHLAGLSFKIGYYLTRWI